jgi:hypothetical protein
MRISRTYIAASLRRLVLAVAAGGLLGLPHTAASGSESADTAQSTTISREYLIKAAILYNFGKFAEWPEDAFSDPQVPFRVCVLGADPFGAALDSIEGKRIRNRFVATARIGEIKDAPRCHLLFISASEQDRLASILNSIAEQPILTVADMPRFARTGGIIALKVVDDRSQLEINVDAADRAGLKLSSKLLRLASTIRTQTAQRPRDPSRP